MGGFPCPPLGDLPDPGIEPASPTSPTLAGGFFTTEPPGKPLPSCKSQVKKWGQLAGQEAGSQSVTLGYQWSTEISLSVRDMGTGWRWEEQRTLKPLLWILIPLLPI